MWHHSETCKLAFQQHRTDCQEAVLAQGKKNKQKFSWFFRWYNKVSFIFHKMYLMALKILKLSLNINVYCYEFFFHGHIEGDDVLYYEAWELAGQALIQWWLHLPITLFDLLLRPFTPYKVSPLASGHEEKWKKILAEFIHVFMICRWIIVQSRNVAT